MIELLYLYLGLQDGTPCNLTHFPQNQEIRLFFESQTIWSTSERSEATWRRAPTSNAGKCDTDKGVLRPLEEQLVNPGSLEKGENQGHMLMAEAKGLECQCRGIGTGSQSDEVGAFVFSAFFILPF